MANISHGEIIRAGVDEMMEIDPANVRFVFQGASDAEYRGKAHGIEVCFAMANWGDNDPAADVVSVIQNDSLEFVLMDGVAMGFTALRGHETQLKLPWHRIIQDLVRRGYFKPPQHGWERAQTAAVYVGTEVNNFTASGAARAILFVEDFRVERIQ